MKLKGTAVRTLPKYIQTNYPHLYDVWLEKLPPESKKIFEQLVFPTKWYPMYESAVLPTEIFAEILKDEPENTAFKVGVFSAEDALNGVYKIFISITSPSFIIKRAPNIFKTYYDPIEVNIERPEDKKVILTVGKLEEKERLMFHRMRGWITKVIEMTQKNALPKVELEPFLNQDGTFTGKFIITW